MGCEYLNTCEEVIDVLGAIQARNLCAMLDTASSLSAGNNPIHEMRDLGTQIVHLHLSEPDLAPLDPASLDYAGLGQACKDYRNGDVWASIEMLRTGDQWQGDCRHAITLIQDCF